MALNIETWSHIWLGVSLHSRHFAEDMPVLQRKSYLGVLENEV